MLQLMDDPVLSPEAQQVIDRLRTLLSQLESTKKKKERSVWQTIHFLRLPSSESVHSVRNLAPFQSMSPAVVVNPVMWDVPSSIKRSIIHPALILAATKTMDLQTVYSACSLTNTNTLSPAVVTKSVMSSVPSTGKHVGLHLALVFTVVKTCQPLQSFTLKNGKKTPILWNKSKSSGKTILFGTASVARIKTPSKDSLENSKTQMSRPAQKFVFWATPKAKSFHT